MKTLLKTAALTLALLATSASAESSKTSPGPFSPLNDDASEIVNILLNSQLSSCVREFQSLGPVAGVGVKRSFVSPDITDYIVRGLLLQIDIVEGSVEMTIRQTTVMEWYGPVDIYTCHVEAKHWL